MRTKISTLAAAAVFVVAGCMGGLTAAEPTADATGDDTTPPEVTILNPEEGSIHVGGIELFPNPYGGTVTLAAFMLRPGVATAVDNVDQPNELTVTVSLDGEQRTTASFVPCDNTFEWQGSLGIGFGMHTLTVAAEDTSGNVGSTEMEIFYLCILPAGT